MSPRAAWALLASVVCLPAADSLEAIQARMDQAAATFRDLTAEFKRTSFTAVLNETSQESGTLWIRRAGPRHRLMRLEFQGPNPRWLAFDGTQGQIYYPKIQTVQIYELGKHRSLVDQFLLLGFGTPGKELAKSYTVGVAAREEAAGRLCTRLELTPKSAEVSQHIQKVELWIPDDRGHAVQQRFVLPGGDHTLLVYSGLRWNTGLSEAQCRLDLPKGVTREFPQK